MRDQNHDRVGRFLVKESQPFGDSMEHHMHPSTIGNPEGSANRPGATTEWSNQGMNQPQSNANKAPGAHAMGCRNADNPFAYVGKSFKSVPTMVGLWSAPL